MTLMHRELLQRLEQRKARVGVVGLGYVGLPLALRLSATGLKVTGFDIDSSKTARIENGQAYFRHIADDAIASALKCGFHATTDFWMLSEMDVVVVCVPTPLDDHHQPDLSYIVSTGKTIAQHLQPEQLVILESTTWPGTTEEVFIPLLEKENPLGLRASCNASPMDQVFYAAYSPEREDPGSTRNRQTIPKVVGGIDEISTECASVLYGLIVDRVVRVPNTATAEMTKLLENIYRSVNIALVNELKMLCLRMGIDVWDVIAAAATKPYGFQPFYPGPGLGGHCIPIDPFYLSWKSREFDFQTRFIELAGEVNAAMPCHVVDSLAGALNQNRKAVMGSRILVLGVAYKKDVDDLRESPALKIIQLLQARGAEVNYHDPYIPHIGRGRKYDLPMDRVPLETVADHDCVLIVTDHSSYDFRQIVEEAQLVVDTRNATQGISSRKIVRC